MAADKQRSIADDPETQEKTNSSGGPEMPFLGHLEELRWRIIWMVLGIVAGAIICGVTIDWLINRVLLQPIISINHNLQPGQQPIHLQNLKPFGQVFLYMQVALVGGIILSLPNVFLQLWRFISPGLLPKERKYISWIVFFSTFCFLAGVVFSYYVMLPAALTFFAGFGTIEIENNIAINEYMSFVISMILGAGIVFELPMVSWFLSKLGILTPAFMRHYRRHAIVVILFLAAILTPGTDPVSQILLAIPLLLLYELSIGISAIAWRKKKSTEEEST